MDKKKIRNLVLAAAAGMAGTAVLAVCIYMLWEKAPEPGGEARALSELHTEKPGYAEKSEASPSPSPDRGSAFQTERRDGVYTLLLVGDDDGTGNTDTIILGKLDTVRHSADFVSIPRDTLINVDNPIRKINAVYWGAKNAGRDGISALISHVKKLSGIEPDCYAVIDLDVFVQAVDELGGIWFDVPERMYYDGGPVIDLEPGYQLLSGEQAMWLCRYRSTYVNGDIDRIDVQHDFLAAAAEQFLSLGSVPNLSRLASLLAENMDTNMTAANMAWFARQLLMCDKEAINFHTAPNTPAMVHELSYTFLDLYDWLEMVNEKLNPYDSPITEGQLDLVYLHNGSVCCTTVINGLSYFTENRKPEPAPEEENGGATYEEQYTEESPGEESADEGEWWIWAEPEESPKEEQHVLGDDWLIFEE